MIKKNKKRYVVTSLICFILLVYLIYYCSSLIFQIYNKYQEKTKLQKEYDEVEKSIIILNKDLKKLNDPEYIAKYAREKFYYSKDGEILIKIP